MGSKVGQETPQSGLFGAFSGSLVCLWGHLGVQVSSRSPFEKLSKKHRNFDDFWASPGGACHCRRPGSPGSIKRTFSAKVAISLQRGANFRFLDFGTPLEKSLSVTFSEQWLCHFSIPVDDPVAYQCHGKPHANFVHGGTVADHFRRSLTIRQVTLLHCNFPRWR